MAEAPKTLPTGPLPHPAMDYAALRSEGLRLLGELGGGQWTDFNSHDPGITILEQCCYAITDLAYRINFTMPDLLAGGDYEAHASLPSAATILGSQPTTISDLRKLAMDACGGSNAWVDPALPACPFFFHEQSGELHLETDPAAVESGAVGLQGLHRVWLPTGEHSTVAARQQAVARLGAARPLCEDIEVQTLRSESIWLDAAVEVAGAVSPQQILDDIVASIEGYLAPQVGFETISEARERCLDRSELLFDGPTLERGFLCDRKLARSPRRRAVYASDLMHAISDVPTVRAIQRLTMAKSANGKAERWALEIAEDGVPTLAAGSKLVLLRDGLPLPLDEGALSAALSRAHARSEDPVLPLGKRDITVVAGRDRDLGRYHSLLNQLPLVYGVGPFGLPASATPARRAQAKQLRAFVAFFDQILANCFAQLAHARELFSHYGEAPRTYFGQVLEDPAINFDALRLLDRGRHQVWLDEAVVDTAVDELGSLERRARFLGHLLARYAEELDEVDVGGQQQAAERTMADIRRKLAFLRDYPRISAGRGSGYDVFR
ncbi:MAG: hypothetical protein KC457_22700, partial [Myxococcales bacterium]|nr:hypothetical protein [Myxococcales bacterium]